MRYGRHKPNFSFLPSLHNSIFAQHQAFQYCSNFVRALAGKYALVELFELVVDLTTEGARAPLARAPTFMRLNPLAPPRVEARPGNSPFAERGVRNSGSGLPRQSGLMPANLTTLAHFSVSAAMSLPKSAGEPASTVPPSSASRALILGSASAAFGASAGS
jgi:hypothetical protein